MSFLGLLNQAITIYPKSGYGADGRETLSTGNSVQARVQETTKRRLLPNGSLATIDAIAYVPGDTTVSTDDRIDYSGTMYKVFGKYGAIGAAGNRHHIKLELVKWQQQ